MASNVAILDYSSDTLTHIQLRAGALTALGFMHRWHCNIALIEVAKHDFAFEKGWINPWLYGKLILHSCIDRITSNKPLEWAGHHFSALPSHAPCLPLKGSVR